MKRYRLMPSVSGFWGDFAARMMFQRDAARKENARLRKALVEISENPFHGARTRQIAREALK